MIRVDLETIMLAAGPVPSVIVLRERNCDSNMDTPARALTIQTGSFEAASISAAMNNRKLNRPLTHDMYSSLLHKLNCTIDRIEITKCVSSIFYCQVLFSNNERETFAIDARPSDALNLAVHFNAPIYVDDDVMNRMSSTKIETPQESSENISEEELNSFLNNISPDDF